MRTDGMKKGYSICANRQSSRWEDNIVCIASLPTSFYHTVEVRCNIEVI